MSIIVITSNKLGTISYDDKQFKLNVDGSKIRYIGNDIKPSQPLGLTNYQYLFAGRFDIEVLDLSDWDMSEITNINSIFSSCINLREIIGIDDMDVSKVEYATNAFLNCRKLPYHHIEYLFSKTKFYKEQQNNLMNELEEII